MTALMTMPPAVQAEPEPYLFTVAQYHAMGEAGVFLPDDRVELIRGTVVRKMTKKAPHRIAGGLLVDVLTLLLPPGWYFQTQEPITLTDSEPEPDGAVVRGGRRDLPTGHPRAAHLGLVIEISDATLATDRGTKRLLYAEAGISVYWIVNLVEGVLEVYTAPEGGDYTAFARLGPTDAVTLTLDGVALSIPVGDLLP